MVSCAACGRTKVKGIQKCGISFHIFPKNEERRSEWLKFVQNVKPEWMPTKQSFLCSEHFTTECFYRLSPEKVRVTETAIPTIPIDRIKYIRTQCPRLTVTIDVESTSEEIEEDTSTISCETTPILEDRQAAIEETEIQNTRDLQNWVPRNTLQITDADSPQRVFLKRKIAELGRQNCLKSKRIRILQNQAWRQRMRIKQLNSLLADFIRKSMRKNRS